MRARGLPGKVYILPVSQRFTGQRDCSADLPPDPGPSTWSRGGAAATFRTRLPHTERELGLVRATAILNAIYYPVETGARTINQQMGSHCRVSWDKMPQCSHTEAAGARQGGLGPQKKDYMMSLPLGACSFAGDPSLRHETAREI